MSRSDGNYPREMMMVAQTRLGEVEVVKMVGCQIYFLEEEPTRFGCEKRDKEESRMALVRTN